MRIRTEKTVNGRGLFVIVRADEIECEAFDRFQALKNLEAELRRVADQVHALYLKELDDA